MIHLAWLILWIPLIAAAAIFFIFLSKPKLCAWIATLSIFASFVLSCLLLSSYLTHAPHPLGLESSIPWIPLASTVIEFGVLINGLTLLMLLVVTGIGTLIFLFSMSYMEHDEGLGRYFASLSFFAFSMLGIVLANNLIQIFVFWELVGVSSYLLIGFWFEKPAASTAGKKAFITTRVGDVGMLIGILLLFHAMEKQGLGSFNFLDIQGNFPVVPPAVLTLSALLIFLGVVGKSAQVPLHVWLPDAMEGPTPVSALIHAATMVAAGVFLLVRLNFFFSASPDALTVIAWTGGITAFLAGTVAVVQSDIKKVLAYSTLSQLGYMVLALGLSHPEAGMFHLTTHAFFKALLFLGAGSLIHALHTQDMWEMSGKGLIKKMPVTSWTFLIAALALMGIPPLSGYFSKEEILTAAQHGPVPLFWLAMAVVFLTAFYMGRLCTVVFFGKPGTAGQTHGSAPTAHEAGWQMTLPLILLAVFSIIAGYLPVKELLHLSHPSTHHSGIFLPLFSISLAVCGFAAAFFLYRHRTGETPANFPKTVLIKKYYFDDLYDAVIRYAQENLALVSDLFERWVVVEGCVNGLAKTTRKFGDLLRKLQTGVIQFYVLIFTAGVTLVLYLMVLKG